MTDPGPRAVPGSAPGGEGGAGRRLLARYGPWLRRRWYWAAIPLAVAGFAFFDMAMTAMPANACANAYVAAVRAGRLDEARAHETIELRARLDALAQASEAAKPAEGAALQSGSELSRAYQRVRASRAIRGGFVGSWTHGCMTGTVDDQAPIWLLVLKVDGVWLIDDLRIDSQPRECVGDTAE